MGVGRDGGVTCAQSLFAGSRCCGAWSPLWLVSVGCGLRRVRCPSGAGAQGEERAGCGTAGHRTGPVPFGATFANRSTSFWTKELSNDGQLSYAAPTA